MVYLKSAVLRSRVTSAYDAIGTAVVQESFVKIVKTDEKADPAMGALRTQFPGKPEVQVDDAGKITVRVSAYIPDNGEHVKHQVVLSGGEIERILECLANPPHADAAHAVAKVMGANLKSLVRLTALGAGTTAID